MPKRRLRIWLLITLACFLLVVTGFLIYGYYLRRQARAVLDDVYTVMAASGREAAFTALREKYADRLMLDGCSGRDCSYHLTVSNRFLSATARIPYTELNVRFDLRNGLVSLIMADYRSAFRDRTSPIVHVQTDFCTGRCGNYDFFAVHPWTQASTAERWNGIVEMGYTTVPPLRHAALSFNTTCLTSFRGCNDIAQLMPEIWKPTADGIRCALPNRTGTVR
jgi:hypothetical protein